MGIKGYKAFNKDMTCRGFQYEENKEYEMEGKPKCCGNGFHFCENPLDTLNYYDLCNSTFAEVEAIGDINKPDKEDREDSKIATNKIKIGAKLDLTGFVKASVDFLWEKCKIKDNKQYYYNEQDWGVQEAYKAFGPQMDTYITSDFINELSGRIWIIDGISDECYQKYFNNEQYKFISQQSFSAKYHEYNYIITLVEK